jgi:hypothetical protein
LAGSREFFNACIVSRFSKYRAVCPAAIVTFGGASIFQIKVACHSFDNVDGNRLSLVGEGIYHAVLAKQVYEARNAPGQMVNSSNRVRFKNGFGRTGDPQSLGYINPGFL